MTVTFKGDYNTYFKPANTPFRDLLDEAIYRGAEVVRLNGKGEISVKDVQDINIATLMVIIGAGMEVYGYECFIKIPSANIDNEIDVAIAGYQHEVDGVTVTKTWRQWGIDSNSTANQDVEGNYYIASNAYNDEPLTGADLKLLNDAGYNLLTILEYQSIFSGE